MFRIYRMCAVLAITIMVVACGGNSPKSKVSEFYKLLDAGSISEARGILYDMQGEEVYRCAEALIGEYIAMGEVHNAIAVYERATPDHCSTYEMQYSYHTHGNYENRVTKLIYTALIEADEFEKAWEYHHLEYNTPTYAGNGGCYFSYVSDVLIHLCQQNRHFEAQQFLDKHSLWFLSNVNNGEWGEKYPNYSYDKVVRELQQIINRSY